MTKKTFIVDALDASQRLDQFCFKQFPDYSRSFFQQLIDREEISVNNRIKKSGYKLKENDVIICNLIIPKTLNLEPANIPISILFEHEDFLIVNKQAGLSVHPSATKPEEITLVNGLLHHYPEFTSFDSKERPGIVHRLDKDTSGILIVARTVQAAIIFSRMFNERTVNKKYLALVHGHTDLEGSIEFPIGRNLHHRHKMTHTNPDGREALTHFNVIQYFEDKTLLSVKIITGRTHQIRVHCTAIGHPIVGDSIYGSTSPLINRQALHAAETSFTYKDKEYSFTAPLPDEMQAALDKLKPYEDI
ncbi:RluA family pseudouridine synthase [Candidatus Babeliales bacterium]|nr:RluA family pseudouridine synthase [Candidatus Babeliales bacterium]